MHYLLILFEVMNLLFSYRNGHTLFLGIVLTLSQQVYLTSVITHNQS